MPFLQPSIEGELFLAEDPWDWNVDQVVLALTDDNSPLLKNNSPLSLPDLAILAHILRDNDVNGLALLTEVTGQSLRDEFGIKSMSHRASINHLIRLLQDQSKKYREYFVTSGRLSSFSGGSRFSTPYPGSPQLYGPRAASRVPGIWQTPMTFGGSLQTGSGIDDILTSVPYRKGEPPRGILAEGAQLPNPQQTELLSNDLAQSDTKLEGFFIDNNSEGQDGSRISKTDEGLNTTASTDRATPDVKSEANTSSIYPEKTKRQGETIIVDETGRKRRRLVLGQPDTFQTSESDCIRLPPQEELSSSPSTLQKDHEEADITDATSFPTNHGSLIEASKPLADTLESNAHAQAEPPRPVPSEVVPEPGTVMVDEQGRKRLRPILLSQAAFDQQEPQEKPQEEEKPTTENPSDSVISASTSFPKLEASDETRKRLYGRTANRSPDQLYIGLEPISVDSVFYGDVGLEKELDQHPMPDTSPQTEQPNDSDNFTTLSSDSLSNGQRLYVNARMKYFLRSQRVLFKRNGQEHIGVIPYPDRIGKKHRPLSVTIFSKSSNGITASRSNRSRWIKDNAIPGPIKSNENVFNVADPALVQDESDDPEWRALEKWKYMEGKDDILPLYGESGSEGEYELSTWKEMEQERGELARPLGRSKSKKLTAAEVEEAIDEAMKQITQSWMIKRQPKLQLKAWRLWMKSRRDGNAQAQMGLFALENEKLETRISNLRKEIAEELWSKSSQVAKQCAIMQPSIFDRENNQWTITTLKSKKAPPKPPPASRKVKVAQLQESIDVLKDGEENLDSEREISESSGDESLDDFIVEDEADAEINEALLGDDDLSMSDVEDGVDSGSLAGATEAGSTIVKAVAEDDHLMADTQDTSDSDSLIGRKDHGFKEEKIPLSLTQSSKDTPRNTNDPIIPSSNFIDLTQQPDPIEPQTPPLKDEPASGIKTPPVFDSENDSEVFQRSRSKKPPVFKWPSAAAETVHIINLDSDSAESIRAESPLAPKTLPAFTSVDGIRKMDPSELVERQDRKRLLIWMIAHVPPSRRKAAFGYLMGVPVEQSYKHVISALKDLRSHKQRMRGVDKELSDNIMQVATWYVCWTIPVKVDLSGLKAPDIDTTLADEDGYEPFYDFLLECMDHYPSAEGHPQRTKPKKKRERTIQADSDEALEISPIRKRKYQVSESQATLEKRQAARERLHADEERREREEDRRRKELEYRFAHMGSDDADSLGVVVNPGKLENQEFVYLSPRFGNGVRLKPHQKDGLQFMWREITADHEDLQGCLLAQTMGLGKTMQVIALLVALSEAAQSSNENIRNQVPPSLLESRSLVLCPPALVENWWDEFILWVPRLNSGNIGVVRKVNSTMKPSERLVQIDTWNDLGGVLLIGYDTFKNLVNNKATKTRAAPLNDSEHIRAKQALLEGPNLIVADEAHQFKSKFTGLNLAMNQIKTKSRIALTGSPLNNNLQEYYTLVDWIAPGYLGTSTEFRATYEEPIREGLYQDSTASQKRESLKRLKALELEMEPKVHRANVSVLHTDLRGKSEFVIRVPLTRLQDEAYNIYVEGMHAAIRGGEPRGATLWSWLGVLQLLCNHPKCYLEKLLEVQAESEDPFKRKAPQPKKAAGPTSEMEALLASDEDASLLDEPVSQRAISRISLKTERLFEKLTEPVDALSLSNKMQILMNILLFAEAIHDKVLVFSHKISTLDYIGKQLAKAAKPYARIDGLQNPNKRQQITKEFNEGSVNVCLISTRAGGTGLNLFGANRVVILDDHFNPMWEQQAIGRAYRFGQKKPVFVYRLTAAGTFEQALQNQALFKEHLATRVVDKKNPTRNALKGAGEYLFPPKRVEQEDLIEFVGKDPFILDKLLADQTKNLILSITPTETFHIEDGIELTPAERIEVEQMQKDEQLRRRDPKAYMARVEQRREANLRNVLQAKRPANGPFDLLWKSSLGSQPAGWHQMIPGMDASHPSSTALAGMDLLSSTAPVIGAEVRGMPPPPTGSNEGTTANSRDEQFLSTRAAAVQTENWRHASNSLPDEHSFPSSSDRSGLDKTQTDPISKSLDKQLLDKQMATPDSSPAASENADAETIDALAKEVTGLFRLTESSSLVPVAKKGGIPKAMQEAAGSDFCAIMARKGLENKRIALSETLRTLYAHDLHQRILLRSPNEDEYRRLVTGVKQLLDREEVKPMHLLQAMINKLPSPNRYTDDAQQGDVSQSHHGTDTDGEKRQPKSKPKKPVVGMLSYLAPPISPETSPNSQGPSGIARAAQRTLDLLRPVNGHREGGDKDHSSRTRSEMKDPKEGSEARKHRLPEEETGKAKKMKGVASVAPNFSGTGPMETDFNTFLDKEATRASNPK